MTDKPRLVIVSGSFPQIKCGVAGHVELIARLTAQRGDYDVHVLTSADALVKPSLAAGYHVHPRIGKWGVLHSRSICREILRLGPDVVHLQNPTIMYGQLRSGTMSAVAPLFKRLAPDVRLAVMQHDIAVSRPLLRWRYYPLFRAADAIFVSNSRDEQAVLAQGISTAKIYRAPVSSHFPLHQRTPEIARQARGIMKIPDDCPCVAHFGFVQPSRNVDVLLRAIHQLRRKLGDVHGLIIGGPFAGAQRYYDKCRQLADRLGLDGHISWTGYASESQVAYGLAAADVFVSLFQRGADMRNTSVICAMLAQLPVVTTENPRYYTDPELAQFGCHCVEPDDPNRVAQAIEQILKDPPVPELLAQRAELLHPDVIWAKHIDAHYRAYRGKAPVNDAAPQATL